MTSRPLIKESLMFLNVCGIDPHKRNIWDNARTVLVVVLLLVLLIDVSLKCFLKWEGLISVDEIMAMTGIYQAGLGGSDVWRSTGQKTNDECKTKKDVLTKLCAAVTQRKSLSKVIKQMEQFWPTNKYGEELEKEIENIIKTVRNLGKFMLILVSILVVIYITQPLFSSPRRLPYSSYHPVDLNQSPNYEITYILQSVLFFSGITILLGFDGLFVSLSINIACELKVVKKSFQNVPINSKIRGDSQTNLLEVYRTIDHHNLVLQCIKQIREIYSILLLNVYFNNLVLICLGLLGVIATGFPPTLQNLSKYGLLAVFSVLQLFLYCVTGSYITTESENVSAAVYNTDWWVKTQPQLRRAFVLVIERANKTEQLTAGGMFILNLDSFTKIIRSALSFFTLVEAIYNDS